MDDPRLFRVFEICLPIFALIALGKVFTISGFMTAEHRQFLNKLVYYYCLPPLVFLGVAKQDLAIFGSSAALIGCFAPVLITALIFMPIAKMLKLRGGLAAAFVLCSFYCNSAYIGFPLISETFGAEGFGVAALYNAIVVPFFLVLAMILIEIYGGARRLNEGIWRKLRMALFNPLVLAGALGVVAAALIPAPAPENDFAWWRMAGKIIGAGLEMIAAPGLPLSLLAVGGALHFGKAREQKLSLGVCIVGKLAVIPLITVALFNFILPGADPIISGTITLINATPCAVVAYVIACQAGADENFVAAQLSLSTVGAALTLPVWVYFYGA